MNLIEHYNRRILDGSVTEKLPFTREQANQAGCDWYGSDNVRGINEVDALRIVNRWNKGAVRFLYWID